MHLEEWIGHRPAANGRQHFQIRMGFFQRHQLTKVTFVGVVPVGHASLRFLQCRPRIVNGHGVILTARTGALQRGEAVAVLNRF